MSERIANCGRPLPDFDEALGTAPDFLAHPCRFWHSQRLEDRRALLKLAFAARLAYTRDEGFRTADLSLPYKVLEDFGIYKSRMARPERFELPTTWFVARYSIQLSYGRWRRERDSNPR